MSLFKSSFLVFLIANGANLFAYLYQFLMGRNLTVEDFGIFSLLNSLGLFVGAFLSVISYLITKYIIEFSDNPKYASIFFWKIFKWTLYVILGVSFFILMYIEKVVEYFNLTEAISFYILIAYLISDVIMGMFLGVLQGHLLHVKASIQRSSSSLFRLIFGFIIVVGMSYSYNGALFASLLANIVIIIWIYRTVVSLLPYAETSTVLPLGTYKSVIFYTIPVALTSLIIGLLSNVDIMLVKHYLNTIEAGEYAAAAVLSRIAIFCQVY